MQSGALHRGLEKLKNLIKFTKHNEEEIINVKIKLLSNHLDFIKQTVLQHHCAAILPDLW